MHVRFEPHPTDPDKVILRKPPHDFSRPWVGLTDDEKEKIAYKAEGNTWTAVELTEAKLRGKNT